VALPLLPQLGLEPNVYYVPPLHTPPEFLRQLFGPGADEALRVYRSAPEDPDLAGLLSLFGCSERVMPRWRRQGDTVAGLDERGGEIVRVPLREPVHIRKAYDDKYHIARTNCP
jgi:nitrate reductase beta subunit